MRRTLLVFAIVIAAALAIEPVIHTHPLTQSANNACAVCVNAHARAATLTAAPASPLVIVGEVTALRIPQRRASTIATLPPRAPPAA